MDLSFNRITEIKNLDKLVKVEKLYLCANKLTKIENLDKLTNLTMLELGDNRLRVSVSLELLQKRDNNLHEEPFQGHQF